MAPNVSCGTIGHYGRRDNPASTMSTDQPYGRPTAYRFDGVKLQGAPRQPLEFVQAAKDFSFRPEDVLVVTYPKSGMYHCEIVHTVWMGLRSLSS